MKELVWSSVVCCRAIYGQQDYWFGKDSITGSNLSVLLAPLCQDLPRGERLKFILVTVNRDGNRSTKSTKRTDWNDWARRPWDKWSEAMSCVRKSITRRRNAGNVRLSTVPYINWRRSPAVRQPFKHGVAVYRYPFWPTYTPKCLKQIILCHLQPFYLAQTHSTHPVSKSYRYVSLWRMSCTSSRSRDWVYTKTSSLSGLMGSYPRTFRSLYLFHCGARQAWRKIVMNELILKNWPHWGWRQILGDFCRPYVIPWV